MGNPFSGTPDTLHPHIERLFRVAYYAGEMDDELEDLLGKWREARGEEAKDRWAWWFGEVEFESYDEDAPTREEAIAIGRSRYGPDARLQIIEARLWSDTVKEGEDTSEFAETRNFEIVEPASEALS